MILKVIFNLPNCVCYVRLLLILVSIKMWFPVLYLISQSLDLIDGEVARRSGQCTMLGAILDMVIDRVSNLVIFSKIFYNHKDDTLIYLLVLDFLSHFIHFSTSMLTNKHHKKVSGILAIYYDKRYLIPICAFSELFFVSLYLNMKISKFLYLFYIVKSFFHLVQLKDAISVVSDWKETA